MSLFSIVEYHLYCKKKLNLKKKTFTFANKVYEAILSYGIVSLLC